MPDFEITGPDGGKYQITAPDGASQDQVLEYAKNNFGSLPHSLEPIEKNNSELPPQPMGVTGRIAAGVMDPIYGGKQLYEHALGSKDSAAAADQAMQDREKELTAKGAPEGDLARSAGRMAPAAIAGLGAAPIVGGVAGAALGGAASELLNPVTSGDYAEEKAKQGMMGAAFGGAGGALVKGAGSIVGPTVREAAAEMMKNGVQLTPGQIAGGILRRAEEAAKSFPVLGSFIRGAERRSVEGFNRAAIDQALEPIGVKLPERAGIGHEAITYAKTRLDDAYDTLLPKMQLSMDSPLASDIANIRYQASSALPKAQYDHLEKIIQDRVQRYFNNTGSIPGDELKKIERDLGSIASSYRSSGDGAQREMAYALDDTRGAIRDALSRQNPQDAAELQKINAAYAMFTRVESAASRKAGSQGVFTPSDLLQSIKSADKTVRKGAFARGDALMQDFAEFADTVLPSKMPDSGTTERAMWDILGTGAIGGGAILAPKIVAAGATAALPYTSVGGKIINSVASPKGPVRTAAGQAIKRAAPVAGSALSPLVSGSTMDYLVEKGSGAR